MTAKRPHKSDSAADAAFIDSVFTNVGSATWLAGGGQNRVWRPPTDVYETDTEIVVQVEVAGAERTDFYLSLDDRRLTVRGVRDDSVPERRAYHQMEIHFGEFHSDVELPAPVDKDQIQAEYHDGFLRVTLLKTHPEITSLR
jgi:HSP20 family molecular chaperone IbpA